jgi:hypothetical protein
MASGNLIVTIRAVFTNRKAVEALTRSIEMVDGMEWSRERERLEKNLRRVANGIRFQTKGKG